MIIIPSVSFIHVCSMEGLAFAKYILASELLLVIYGIELGVIKDVLQPLLVCRSHTVLIGFPTSFCLDSSLYRISSCSSVKFFQVRSLKVPPPVFFLHSFSVSLYSLSV